MKISLKEKNMLELKSFSNKKYKNVTGYNFINFMLTKEIYLKC
jgi:hypothetical protein